MLISFSLSNFNGFKRLEAIDLKPLTVICGPNNSGKSSIIQSLLLMKQSRRISRITLLSLLATDIRSPLILDGKNVLAHLGNWEDVIYKHEKHQKMALRTEFETSDGNTLSAACYQGPMGFHTSISRVCF